MRVIDPEHAKPATELVPLEGPARPSCIWSVQSWSEATAFGLSMVAWGAGGRWPTGRERGGGGEARIGWVSGSRRRRRRGLECRAFVGNSLAGLGLWGSLTPMTHRRRTQSPLDSPTPSSPALDAASVEAVAQRVVELLRTERHSPRERRLVDASTLAAELGVERSWVYAHRAELGAIQLGSGSKPRLRFEVDMAQDLLARSISRGAHTPAANGSSPRRRKRLGSSFELLPIRGSATTFDVGPERS